MEITTGNEDIAVGNLEDVTSRNENLTRSPAVLNRNPVTFSNDKFSKKYKVKAIFSGPPLKVISK